MFRAYGLRVAIFAIVGLLLGVTVSLLTPPKYEAVMQLLVDQKPVQNARPMTEPEEQVVDLLESTGPRSVSTQVEQLTGYRVLGSAAEAVMQRRGSEATQIKELRNLKDLQKAVTIEAVTQSDLVTMRVRLPDKEIARELAGEIYNSFATMNLDNARQAGSLAVATLESQMADVQGKMDGIAREIERTQLDYNVTNLPLQVQSEIQSARAVDEAEEQARIELQASETLARTLRQQMASIPKTIQAASNVGMNPTFQSVDSALAASRAELAGLQVTWAEDSIQVRDVKQRIAQLEKERLDAARQIDAGASVTPNPLYQSLAGELAQATSAAAAARARLTAATQASSARKQSLARLPVVQTKLEALDREKQAYERMYQAYKQRLDTLKIGQRGRMTTSTVVTPATAFDEPVSPNYPLNIGAGLIAGLLLGALSAFNTESRRSPIRTLSQLNRLTLEPAFRTVPELPFVPLGMEKQPDEVFMGLLGNYIRSAKRPYRLGVMGVDIDSGATVTASSMALAASIERHRTLIVDTARENGVSKRLGLENGDSLATPSETLTVLRTHGEDLSRAGSIIEHIETLEGTHELTILDLQPFRGGNNPVLYLTGLDECILLVRAGRTRTVDFLQAQQMLLDAGVPHVTVVMARARTIDDDFSFLPAPADVQALTTR